MTAISISIGLIVFLGALLGILFVPFLGQLFLSLVDCLRTLLLVIVSVAVFIVGIVFTYCVGATLFIRAFG